MNLFLTHFISINRAVASRATPYLFLLMAMMVALFLEAYMHNFNIVYITLFVIFSLALSGCYFGRVNLYYLKITPLSQGRIFAKKPSNLKWRIINTNSNPAYDITLTCKESQKHFKHIDKEEILTLSPVFEKRGDTKMPDIKIQSRFPLLHVRFIKVQKSDTNLCIYPYPDGIALKNYLKEQNSHHGERSDFEGLRVYQNSDIPSLIHWVSLAKSGELMSRNFSYVTQLQTLHFDFLSCAKDDEARVSQLCLWILECEKLRREFSIKMPSETLYSKEKSTDELLQKLARY